MPVSLGNSIKDIDLILNNQINCNIRRGILFDL